MGLTDDECNKAMQDLAKESIDFRPLRPTGDSISQNLEQVQQAMEARLRSEIDKESKSSLYPRAHAPIANLNVIEDIARENQLNPLYESTLKEFDEAKAAMSRAAHKLAAAVKLTDSDELDARVNGPMDAEEPASVSTASILARIRQKSTQTYRK
jgi:hypothetical protein